jgi:protein gp37
MPVVVSQALGGKPPLENLILGVTIESNKYVGRADFLRQTPAAKRCLSLSPLLDSLPNLDLTGIDWVSLGSECSRENREQSRRVEADWVRSVRDRCVSRGIPFMFTSWGQPSSNPDPKNDPSFPNDPHGGCFLDGVEWDESLT